MCPFSETYVLGAANTAQTRSCRFCLAVSNRHSLRLRNQVICRLANCRVLSLTSSTVAGRFRSPDKFWITSRYPTAWEAVLPGDRPPSTNPRTSSTNPAENIASTRASIRSTSSSRGQLSMNTRQASAGRALSNCCCRSVMLWPVLAKRASGQSATTPTNIFLALMRRALCCASAVPFVCGTQATKSLCIATMLTTKIRRHIAIQ